MKRIKTPKMRAYKRVGTTAQVKSGSKKDSANTNVSKTTATESRVKACGYARKNTRDPEVSIAEQKAHLVELAEREGYEIIQWYVDNGVGGSLAHPKKVAWLQLLADAATAEWEVVLCYDRARFSRMDSIEEGFAKQTLREAHKKIHTAVEGLVDWDTSTGRIMDEIRTEASNDYSQKIAHRVLEGKCECFRRGKSIGQTCPYGMAYRITDPRACIHLISRKERFPVPKGWSKVFVPGDPEEIKIVRWLFDTYATTDTSLTSLAKTLNSMGVPSPRSHKWLLNTVKRLITNDIYVGDTRFGRRSIGKFARLEGDRVVAAVHLSQPTTGPGLLRRSTHEGIIDRDLWDRVQVKLNQSR